uniref:ANK_REP_REGION domain-containing protein n=1 Tax=Macrostomum lignano TaxID=282301 RepID=A0A1I8JKX1_9PLAT
MKNQSLIEAVKRGNLKDTCQILRNQRCGIDCADESGKTALQWATKYGHVTIVWHLIKAGAQVDRQDLKGWTPLHEAASFGRSQCACLLMELGAAANPNLRTAGEGNSPVHLAAEKGHSEVLRWLLSGGRANVNQQLTDGRSAAHKAARQGRWKSLELRCISLRFATTMAGCVETLLCTGAADPNVLDNDSGFSPLHLAAACGRKSAVDYLLRACCHQPAAGGRQTRDKGALSPAQLAAGFGQDAVLLQLIQDWNLKRSSAQDFLNLPKCFEEILNRIQDLLKADKSVSNPKRSSSTLSDEQLSLELHSAMRLAGFERRRAAAQSALSDALQEIVRGRWPGQRRSHIAAAVARMHMSKLLNTRTGMFNARVLIRTQLVNLRHPLFDLQSTSFEPASAAVIPQSGCCRRATHPRLGESVLSCLRRELTDSQCHLVTAAPPGETGLLRVSTSFLERILLRSLTTEQGQVFVLLKYLLKRVLSERAPGLKTYHAKTLIFYLLEETPEDEWQPNCLLSITGKGLEKLRETLKLNPSEPDQCMMHFFLKDAWLYLKKGHCDLIDQLPQLLLQFKANLRPTSDDEPFHFHPFLVIPESRPRPVQQLGRLQYHSLPDLVAEVLQKLTQEACSESLKASLESINRIPDFAKTTQQCLLVLVYLKFNLMHLAQQLLRDVMKCKPNGGPILKDLEPATAQSVLTHLESSDSAWKFCLWFNSCPPNLDFLPDLLERTRRHFPTSSWAWLMGETARLWFEETLHCRNPDVQQLVVSMEFCPDRCLLAKLIVRHRDAICNLRVTRDKAMQLMRDDTELLTRCAELTLETAAAKLLN